MSAIVLALQAHSALHPAGPQAASINRLHTLFLALAALVHAAVIAAVLWAAWRPRTLDEQPRSPERQGRAHRAIFLATSATVAIVFVALVYDLAVARAAASGAHRPALSIRLTGHQWWWEVEYEDSLPQNHVRTANEIHIPVGRQVVLKLTSNDVIHSFWAPSLGGKKDLIPGHPSEFRLEATMPGIYRAPCAEFCGLQHANMSLLVIAESEPAFFDWLARQRHPAIAAVDSNSARGQLVFESGSCATCHTISGTSAHGTVGPDLTHLASRLALAAGARANTSGNLAGWIVDPQGIKPGTLMPSNRLEPSDLQALLAYLGTLR